MRVAVAIVLMICAQTAHADPGHLIEVAGHSHWIAGVAIGLAGLAALWGAKKGDAEAEADEEFEEEPA